MKIAVVGAGIAGLGAAWALSRRHEVTLFEASERAGGHANTLTIDIDGRSVAVDTGFIVYNERNYRHLTSLFDHLGVATLESDMSFAVSLDGGSWEMAGRALGLFGTPAQIADRSHWRLLGHTVRFFRHAESALCDPATEGEALGTWLQRHAYDEAFVRRFLAPMAGAIWSSSLDGIMDYPVRSFVAFFRNHQLLKFAGRVRWRTVHGGSRNYVERVLGDFGGTFRPGCAVHAVEHHGARPALVLEGGERAVFDDVVLACHGDQAARLLRADRDRHRASVLGAFRYQRNEAWLHADAALMPRRRRLWSSWNYLGESCGDGTGAIAVSYWMNRLQRLDTDRDVFVTLNPPKPPREETVFARVSYDHPQFDLAALRAKEALPGLQGRQGLWFCGSYTGYGFHEDGLRSGLEVAAALGAPAPWWTDEDGKRASWTVSRPAMEMAA